MQNILALRFGNSMFEPIWNAQGIDNVQITIAETVGLEDRAGYYEGAGALRDMVANHMLQLVALIAMEPPRCTTAPRSATKRPRCSAACAPSLSEAVPQCTVTGQYEEGAVGGKVVKGYDDELGYDSDVETFVAIKAHIDNWRWQGVPFYLRTGKRMAKRRSEIAIQFKPVPHSMFRGRGRGCSSRTRW